MTIDYVMSEGTVENFQVMLTYSLGLLVIIICNHFLCSLIWLLPGHKLICLPVISTDYELVVQDRDKETK